MCMTQKQMTAFDYCQPRSLEMFANLPLWLYPIDSNSIDFKAVFWSNNQVSGTKRCAHNTDFGGRLLTSGSGWHGEVEGLYGRTNPYLFSAAGFCWTKGCCVWDTTAPASPASRPPPPGDWGEGSNTGTPPASMGGRGGWKLGVECCFLFIVPALRGVISGCLLAGLQGRGETVWNTHTREGQWGISLHRREGGEGQDHHLTTGTATRERYWEWLRF